MFFTDDNSQNKLGKTNSGQAPSARIASACWFLGRFKRGDLGSKVQGTGTVAWFRPKDDRFWDDVMVMVSD
jgi:hypothetical protein